MSIQRSSGFPRILEDYCRVRLARALGPGDLVLVRAYLLRLHDLQSPTPADGDSWAWPEIARDAGLDVERVVAARHDLRPILIVLERAVRRRRVEGASRSRKPRQVPAPAAHPGELEPPRSKPGRKPNPVVEFPEPNQGPWENPSDFAEALDLHMRRHSDTVWRLHQAIAQPGETFDRTTLNAWRRGRKAPQTADSIRMLTRIERRYRLPAGYFRAKLPHRARSSTGFHLPGIPAAERRRLAWHLPDDFDERPPAEREEILNWVRNVIVSGATEYRRYQSAAAKTRYGLRFPNLTGKRPSKAARPPVDEPEEDFDPDLLQAVLDAPTSLEAEMTSLVRFKTATLTAFGFQRNGVWEPETAAQKIEHLGLLFGALAAPRTGPVRGRAVPLAHISMGLLVFPAVWDWYVQWREGRRGFYTRWEVEMLHVACALTRKGTGWMRQMPSLAIG